jgi:hypothetical protein
MGVDISSLEEVVFDPKKSFLRVPTLGIKAEFLPQVKGQIKFLDAFSRAKFFSLDGISIPILGYDDLIQMKKDSNRPKDLGDVDELEKRRGATDNA